MNNTKYSDDVEGDDGNFNQAVRFDITDGYIGITQSEIHDVQRVLLTPRQVKKMLIFLKRK